MFIILILSTIRRLYLIFNIVKLTAISKDLISGKYIILFHLTLFSYINKKNRRSKIF